MSGLTPLSPQILANLDASMDQLHEAGGNHLAKAYWLRLDGHVEEQNFYNRSLASLASICVDAATETIHHLLLPCIDQLIFPQELLWERRDIRRIGFEPREAPEESARLRARVDFLTRFLLARGTAAKDWYDQHPREQRRLHASLSQMSGHALSPATPVFEVLRILQPGAVDPTRIHHVPMSTSTKNLPHQADHRVLVSALEQVVNVFVVKNPSRPRKARRLFWGVSKVDQFIHALGSKRFGRYLRTGYQEEFVAQTLANLDSLSTALHFGSLKLAHKIEILEQLEAALSECAPRQIEEIRRIAQMALLPPQDRLRQAMLRYFQAYKEDVILSMHADDLHNIHPLNRWRYFKGKQWGLDRSLVKFDPVISRSKPTPGETESFERQMWSAMDRTAVCEAIASRVNRTRSAEIGQLIIQHMQDKGVVPGRGLSIPDFVLEHFYSADGKYINLQGVDYALKAAEIFY